MQIWDTYFEMSSQTATPVERMSSYSGEGYRASIKTGSISVSTSHVIRHNLADSFRKSPLTSGTTTATSISLSSRAVPLLYEPYRYTVAGPIAETTLSLYLRTTSITSFLPIAEVLSFSASIPYSDPQIKHLLSFACKKGTSLLY